MKITPNLNTNARYYCNAVQLGLPLDLELMLDKNDMVFSFLDAIEGVDLSGYVKQIRSNNTKSHDRGVLLRTALFGYMINRRSLDELEESCKTDVRFMMLSQNGRPSHMAFQRLFSELTTTMEDIFFEISSHMAKDKMLCNLNVQYVDGTKIEANANKNSFVYKKRIINTRERLFEKITDLICKLYLEYRYNIPIKKEYDSLDIGYICQYLMEVMVRENIEINYGKGHKKHKIQKLYDEFLGYYVKLMEYEYWLDILQERNSCSKIDHDATFMATKWDYYNQSGQTRPCYNCQIAVSDGIIVNAGVYQNPADTLTWQDFMEQYKRYYGCYPKWPVADAGYGSYDNYFFNILKGIELVQKYTMYGKKEDKEFRKKKYNTFNWETNDEGYKICPSGRTFDQYVRDRLRITNRGNMTITHLYCEKGKCEGCPFRNECLKEAPYKYVGKDVIQEEFHAIVDANLNSEQGKEIRKQRSIQVEGAFGVIKQNMKFTRFMRRGMKNVKMEFLLVCLGYNFRKYHYFRLQNRHNNINNLMN